MTPWLSRFGMWVGATLYPAPIPTSKATMSICLWMKIQTHTHWAVDTIGLEAVIPCQQPRRSCSYYFPCKTSTISEKQLYAQPSRFNSLRHLVMCPVHHVARVKCSPFKIFHNEVESTLLGHMIPNLSATISINHAKSLFYVMALYLSHWLAV